MKRLRLLARRAVLAGLLATAVTLLAGAPAEALAPPASKAARITFGVQPATRASFDSTRADFSYSATPGAVIADYIAVRNYANAPVTLQTYPGDAFNSPSGAYNVLGRTQRSKDLGAWIKLARASVTVPGRGFIIIPFRVQLPASATPGDHDAGIVAAVITQQVRSNGNKVFVEERVGARVHVRVSGPLRPQLEVQQLKTTFSGSVNPFGTGVAKVSYAVVNTGNVRLSAGQQVTVKGLIGGSKSAPKLGSIPELLPGNTYLQTVKLAKVWPGFRLTATVTLHPASSSAAPVPGLVSVRKSATTWAIPWTLVGLVVLLIALAFAIRWRRRRTASRPVIRATRERELVGAGAVAAGSKRSPAPAQKRSVDLRDPAPVDIRDAAAKDPDASAPIDLREPGRDSELPDGGTPPPANPSRN